MCHMTGEINWLHISDIHFQPKKGWRDSVGRQNLLRYLAAQYEDGLQRPDFIFCTGDIAFGELESSSLSDQYKEAAEFFDELREICGTS